MHTPFVVRKLHRALAITGLVAAMTAFGAAAPAEAAPPLPGLATNVYVTYSSGPANIGAPGTSAMFRIYNTSTTPAKNVQTTMFTYFANADGSHFDTGSFTYTVGPIAPGAYVEVPVACGAPQGKWCSSFGVMTEVQGQLDTNKDDNAATKMGNHP